MGAVPSVLMLDDDPSHLRIYSWILQIESCDPVTALVGVDAVDLLVDRTFSLIVFDLGLAGEQIAVDVTLELQKACPGYTDPGSFRSVWKPNLSMTAVADGG